MKTLEQFEKQKYLNLETFRKNGQTVKIHAGDRITSTMSTDSRIVWPTMSVTGDINGVQ